VLRRQSVTTAVRPADIILQKMKIRIVLEGLRSEDSTAELRRKEGINQNRYYRWSREFLEAGKKRLAGDTVREATSDEVKDLLLSRWQQKSEVHQCVWGLVIYWE